LITKEEILFNVGDILYDLYNKDVGVLLRRYSLFDPTDPSLIGVERDEELENILVWDIFWTGPSSWLLEPGIQTYTENGLKILLQTGNLKLYKNT
jgi:hypothetical protein